MGLATFVATHPSCVIALGLTNKCVAPESKIHDTPFDAPPIFFKNSHVSPKVKTTKEEIVGVHSLVRNIWGVRGMC